jgi:photosystem II stability/assembly factor-like uncharacterized protein
MFRTAFAAMLATLSLLPAASPAADFRDVLDVPAVASPFASKRLLNGLARAGTRVVAVGQRGHIVYSDDNGRTWTQAKAPISSDLVAVAFPTASRGWAVGHDGVVLHTVDAGLTWTRQLDGRSPGQNAENPILDVWFDDERTGFVVGAFNQVLRTTDAGRTWESWSERTDNPKALHLYAIRRCGSDLFVSGEQGLLLKLDPQSGRFRALDMPYAGTLFGIACGAKSVVAFGLRGNAYRSVDRGETWQKVDTGLQVGITGGASAAGRIVLVSQAGHMLVSADDGASFKPVKIEKPVPATAVVGAGSNAVVIAGVRGVRALPLN